MDYLLGIAQITINDEILGITSKSQPVQLKVKHKEIYVKPSWSNDEKEKKITVKPEISFEFTIPIRIDSEFKEGITFERDYQVLIETQDKQFLMNRCDVVKENICNFKNSELSETKYTVTAKKDDFGIYLTTKNIITEEIRRV